MSNVQCSVSCGDGQQTREVFCVGAGGEHLAEQACSGLARPPTVQACHKQACHTHISWHVNDFGLVRQIPFFYWVKILHYKTL